MRKPIGTIFRHDFPAEKITFHAFQGQCRYCADEADDPGIVAMRRNPDTLVLEPEHCWCLGCGQRYYVRVADLPTWEREQRLQKANQS